MRPPKKVPRPWVVHAIRCAGGGKEGVNRRIKPPSKSEVKVSRKKNDVRREKDRLPLVLGRHSGPYPNDTFADLSNRKPPVRDRQKKRCRDSMGRENDADLFPAILPTTLGRRRWQCAGRLIASGLEGMKDACRTWD
jgi:hypothetical protein